MTSPSRRQRIIVGITGASGALYARRLLRCLCDADVAVHLIVSPHGRRLLRDELGVTEPSAEALLGQACDHLTVHPYADVGAVIASGSFHTDGMVVCPCSSNTMASMATGLADNLLNRAAMVTLKEARRLVIVPREMPMSRIDLQNALRLNEAGAVICPASPGFYLNPKSIDDLIDFVAGRVMDLLKIPHQLDTRWADHIDDESAPGTSG